MKTSQLERRILIFFFIATFTTFCIITLTSWQIIRFSIRQEEDREINNKLSQINQKIDDFTHIHVEMLHEVSQSPPIVAALQSQNSSRLRNLFNQITKPTGTGIFYAYNNEKEMIHGESFPIIQDNIAHLLEKGNLRHDIFYPVTAGQDIYTLYGRTLTVSDNEDNIITGYIFYLTLFDRSLLNSSSQPQPVLFTGDEPLPVNAFPERYRPHVEKMNRLIDKLTEQRLRSQPVRLSHSLGGGFLIHYDAFAYPAMMIFSPYERELNQFAHKGLLAFFLIILGLALLTITLAGTWFKGKVISPVKEVSDKMRQIRNNPARIEPMEKNYKGILGEMIQTFNSMNNALISHRRSLLVHKTITDNLDAGILWMDDELNIILCNPAIIRIFDLSCSKDLVGKNLSEIIKLDEDIQQEAKTNGIFIPYHAKTTLKGDKYIKYVIFTVKKIASEVGTRHIVSIYDITKETKDRKARETMEMELVKSNRLAELGKLAEGILHNLNSPLNTITGYCQLLKKVYPDNSDIDKMMKATGNISHNVKKLLSKVKEDSISMVRPLDINKLLSLELDMCRHNIFFFQNVTLEKKFGKLHKKVYATHGDISTCVANIVNNAIQSMKQSSVKVLTVETVEGQQCTFIKISDTGCGITEEELPYIFSPGFTTKNSERKEGYGLGLAISRSIIEKYHGKIKVKSSPGKGSTFTICLPNSGSLINE